MRLAVITIIALLAAQDALAQSARPRAGRDRRAIPSHSDSGYACREGRTRERRRCECSKRGRRHTSDVCGYLCD